MTEILTGEPDQDGFYWLDQMDIPQYVKDQIILDRSPLTPEKSAAYAKLGFVVVPLVDIGVTKDEIDDIVLSAMGYDEADLPKLAV